MASACRGLPLKMWPSHCTKDTRPCFASRVKCCSRILASPGRWCFRPQRPHPGHEKVPLPRHHRPKACPSRRTALNARAARLCRPGEPGGGDRAWTGCCPPPCSTGCWTCGACRPKKGEPDHPRGTPGAVELLKALPVELTEKGTWPMPSSPAAAAASKQVDPKTMESQLCAGLYFAGEVLDVDAYTGGNNLGIAFATARPRHCYPDSAGRGSVTAACRSADRLEKRGKQMISIAIDGPSGAGKVHPCPPACQRAWLHLCRHRRHVSCRRAACAATGRSPEDERGRGGPLGRASDCALRTRTVCSIFI